MSDSLSQGPCDQAVVPPLAPAAGLRVAILGSRGYPSSYGGFETFVRRIAPWLVARGHEVTVYGRTTGRMKTHARDGVQVIETAGLSGKNTSTVTHGLTAALHCVRRPPDVVLALNVANGPALPLLRARGIPVVMNVDGIEWEREKWGRGARAAFRIGARMSARFANQLIADSREVQRIWQEEMRALPCFIAYGADVIKDAPLRGVEQLGLAAGGYALVVARLAPENNVEVFLDALERLDWRVPAVIVGSANYRNPLEARLEHLAQAGKVTWLGHVDDQELLTSLWFHAGVYFHGHSVGGTNPAMLQALGCGAPTIAVDSRYTREVLGEAGWIVGCKPDVVANAIETLISDGAERERYSRLGRKLVQERYSWGAVMMHYEQVLRSAASGVPAQFDSPA